MNGERRKLMVVAVVWLFWGRFAEARESPSFDATEFSKNCGALVEMVDAEQRGELAKVKESSKAFEAGYCLGVVESYSPWRKSTRYQVSVLGGDCTTEILSVYEVAKRIAKTHGLMPQGQTDLLSDYLRSALKGQKFPSKEAMLKWAYCGR